MNRLLSILLMLLLLSGCASAPTPGAAEPTEPTSSPNDTPLVSLSDPSIPYTSRFSTETIITLSDGGIDISGKNADTIHLTNDIIYYEDRNTYDSGNPYGEGKSHERHSAAEAAAHTVVNITTPGAYRVSGKLSAGQIRIDLGKKADEDPNAVVELILDNADITCTVAPAILFLNVYECDGNWSADTAKPEVDTTAAGANLILEGSNAVTGSHVAKIYKDKNGEKKLWKQDAAIYSYMSMNIFGPGALDLTADSEGLGTELHLTINGGHLAIRSNNDGINTNEDGVSVTTINAGSLHIIAGLGAEGDGIDSNGYLVINGGTVVASANPASDAGLDSDLGSFIHGGTVIALGAAMDWAENDSRQVTMNLQFAQYQNSGSSIVVTHEDSTAIFAYNPSEDDILGENVRRYQSVILSCPNFHVGESYEVFLNGILTGTETGGIYDVVTAYDGGTQMMYTGTDVIQIRPGSTGSHRPEDSRGGGKHQEPPEGWNGEMSTMPQGETMPEGFGGGRGQMPGGFPGQDSSKGGNTVFYMQDKVNFFSGLTQAE